MRILLVTALTLTLQAADPVSGPVSGHLFRRDAGTVRAVHGFPGGATLGPVLDTGTRITAFHAASGTAVGIVDGYPALLQDVGRSTQRITRLSDLTSAPEVLAAQGEYAAVWSRSDRKLLSIDKLSSTEPVVSVRLEDTVVSALAVSASGRLIVAITSDEGTTLLTAARGEPLTRAARFDGAVALSFAEAGDALIADAAKNEVLTLDSAGELKLLASARDGISQPVGVAGSNGITIVVNAASQTLQMIGSEQIETFDLPTIPDRLERIAANGAWRWNDGAPGVQYLFDAANRSVFFIPAESQTNE